MKYLKKFESFNMTETCSNCGCDCDNCDCDNCDCGKNYDSHEEETSVVERKKAKPDFLDLDKDGNKKESMKKAAEDAKSKKKETTSGLTAKQKKLPPALQKAILARKKK